MEDLHSWQNKFISCIYSDKLINRLLQINIKLEQYNLNSIKYINIELIKKAIYYAKKYHGSQKRDSGEPYYSHPLEVTYMVSEYCCKNEILVTSILHDTIEDTDLTKEMIAKIFNQQIAENVENLTRIKPHGKITAAETVRSLWFQNQQDLLLIKYFDRLHNLQTINAKSPNKIYKNIQETLQQFASLSLHFQGSIPGLHKENQKLLNLCLNALSNYHLNTN